MNTYIGLDVHSSTSTLVSVSETGKILNRCRIPTTEKNLLGFVRNEKKPMKLVVEETNLAHTTNAPTIALNHPAVWTGSKMIVFGGWDGSYYNSGGYTILPQTLGPLLQLKVPLSNGASKQQFTPVLK